jgi:hypothetical protein
MRVRFTIDTMSRTQGMAMALVQEMVGVLGSEGIMDFLRGGLCCQIRSEGARFPLTGSMDRIVAKSPYEVDGTTPIRPSRHPLEGHDEFRF